MLYDPVTLALDTISTVWRRENLGEPHNVFVDTKYWLDEDGERQALQRAGDDMAMHGLLMGRDLSPDFRETLEILARPSVEYFGWIGVMPTHEASGSNIAVLAASVGQDGVLAIRDGDQVTLGPCSADGLAEALVDKMPNVPAGHGRSVNLPEREVRQLRAPARQRRAGRGASAARRRRSTSSPGSRWPRTRAICSRCWSCRAAVAASCTRRRGRAAASGDATRIRWCTWTPNRAGGSRS